MGSLKTAIKKYLVFETALVLLSSSALADTDWSSFGDLVDQYAKDPSFIHYTVSEDQYDVQVLNGANAQQQLRSDLGINSDSLENQYFKVVEDESNTALPWTDVDGRNALHHMMIARAFYKNLDPENPAINKKITVRVRVDHSYNVVTEFAETADHNNSRYIAPDYKSRWQSEIWFDSPKDNTDWKRIGFQTILSAIPSPYLAPLGFLISMLEYHTDGLDTVKDPAICYHETFHWASDVPGMLPVRAYGNPVAEDFANYFGSAINGKPAIANVLAYSDWRIARDFSKIQKVDPKQSETYNYQSLVPSVFWKVQTDILKNPSLMHQVVWTTVKKMPEWARPSDTPKALIAAMAETPGVSADQIQVTQSLLDSQTTNFQSLDTIFAPYYKALGH